MTDPNPQEVIAVGTPVEIKTKHVVTVERPSGDVLTVVPSPTGHVWFVLDEAGVFTVTVGDKTHQVEAV